MRPGATSVVPAVARRSCRKRVRVIGGESNLRARVVRALHNAALDEAVVDRDHLDADALRNGAEAVIVCECCPAAVLEAVRETRASAPACPVIAVWPAANSGDPRRVLRAGADGLVSETDLERELGPTVRAACAGLTCVPLRYRAVLDAEALSMREKQIMGMLVRGFTNAEIATKLFLAESTVKSHLSSAYAKLGVRSRQAAASMILDPEEGLGPGILAISAA